MITSTQSETVKRIKALRTRKGRDASSAYWIEGIRILGEAAHLNAPIQQVVYAPDLLTSGFARELISKLDARGVWVVEVSTSVFESISDKDGPQGVGAVVGQQWTALDTITPTRADLWVALESAQDPGNIGTILRAADSVGAAGVFFLGDCADPYDPGSMRASMGAGYALELVKTTLRDLTAWKQQHKLQMVGTSDAGAEDYRDVPYEMPCILLMGSERLGLPNDYIAACDHIARLPMRGRSDSLNLAVATGVMLYHIVDTLEERA